MPDGRQTCHVVLYGVWFDFNKATLQASSDAALQPAANLMAADKALKLEVQVTPTTLATTGITKRFLKRGRRRW